jgi:hypothetical protein
VINIKAITLTKERKNEDPETSMFDHRAQPMDLAAIPARKHVCLGASTARRSGAHSYRRTQLAALWLR